MIVEDEKRRNDIDDRNCIESLRRRWRFQEEMPREMKIYGDPSESFKVGILIFYDFFCLLLLAGCWFWLLLLFLMQEPWWWCCEVVEKQRVNECRWWSLICRLRVPSENWCQWEIFEVEDWKRFWRSIKVLGEWCGRLKKKEIAGFFGEFVLYLNFLTFLCVCKIKNKSQNWIPSALSLFCPSLVYMYWQYVIGGS